MRVMADTEFIRFFVIVEMTFTNYAIASSGLSVLHNNRHIAFSQSLSLSSVYLDMTQTHEAERKQQQRKKWCERIFFNAFKINYY